VDIRAPEPLKRICQFCTLLNLNPTKSPFVPPDISILSSNESVEKSDPSNSNLTDPGSLFARQRGINWHCFNVSFFIPNESEFFGIGFFFCLGRGHSLKRAFYRAGRKKGKGNQGADVTSMNTFRHTAVTLFR